MYFIWNRYAPLAASFDWLCPRWWEEVVLLLWLLLLLLLLLLWLLLLWLLLLPWLLLLSGALLPFAAGVDFEWPLGGWDVEDPWLLLDVVGSPDRRSSQVKMEMRDSFHKEAPSIFAAFNGSGTPFQELAILRWFNLFDFVKIRNSDK